MTILVGAGILAGVLALIAIACLFAWFLARSRTAFLVLASAFMVAISWIIGSGALGKPMPPLGVIWFAFGSGVLLIWAILEPPGTTGRLWRADRPIKEADNDW